MLCDLIAIPIIYVRLPIGIRARIHAIGRVNGPPSWMTEQVARELLPRPVPAEKRGLCLAEAIVICASTVARPPLLYLIILPAADLAYVVATESIAEHEKTAAGTRIIHGQTLK
jgi:hypothetical protein